MSSVEYAGTRVTFLCPNCETSLSVGHPRHRVTMAPSSGVSVTPDIACPECLTHLRITRNVPRALGRLRLPPAQSKTIFPATRSNPAPVVAEMKPVPKPEPRAQVIDPEPVTMDDIREHPEILEKAVSDEPEPEPAPSVPQIDPMDFTKKELKAMAAKRGLPTVGNKTDLAAHINADLHLE